jgi:hypothetical protein
MANEISRKPLLALIYFINKNMLYFEFAGMIDNKISC